MTAPASSPMPHILMTRFNLATPGREAAIRTQPDWLAGRFDLFEKFCLPSVAAQTSRDFTWIIYFDKDTPQEFKDRVTTLQREFPFEAYYTGLFPASGWPRSIAEVLGRRPEIALTSRLDNDDALAIDYIERTANAALGLDPAPRIAIVVTEGFIRSETNLYQISHPCNAFTSWLERTDEEDQFLTANGIIHMDAEQFGPLVQVPGPGGWLQVVHGGNVSNKVRGRRVPISLVADRVPARALEGLVQSSNSAIALENAVLTPLRNLRDKAVGVVRGFRRKAA